MSERPTRRVVLKYALFQAPGAVLVGLVLLGLWRWLDLPGWAAALVLALWLTKDIILFPFTWRSYSDGAADAGQGLLGVRGVVRERLAPRGRIALGGGLWQAEAVDGDPVEIGAAVRVVEVRGLVLVVELAPPEEGEAEEQAQEQERPGT